MEYDHDVRATLKSTGEAAFAMRVLPESHTVADYIAAVTRAREAGAGEAYATVVLGEQEDDDVDTGQEVFDRAMATLRASGVTDPSYAQLQAALVEASS
jgi:hypothetical protein